MGGRMRHFEAPFEFRRPLPDRIPMHAQPHRRHQTEARPISKASRSTSTRWGGTLSTHRAKPAFKRMRSLFGFRSTRVDFIPRRLATAGPSPDPSGAERRRPACTIVGPFILSQFCSIRCLQRSVPAPSAAENKPIETRMSPSCGAAPDRHIPAAADRPVERASRARRRTISSPHGADHPWT